MLCDNEASKGCVIRVMPDVHPGKVGTIGLTMTIGNKILPNLVGIDIGCGMTLGQIKARKIEFQKLDTVIRENIPAGFSIRTKPHRFADNFDFTSLHCHKNIQIRKALLNLGTLGGGNRFIEADADEEGKEVEDIDSIPGNNNEWNKEDDLDKEFVKVKYFDLALKKWVSKTIIIENNRKEKKKKR